MNILKNIEILDLKSSSLGDHLFKNSGTAIAPNTRRIDNCEADQAKHQLKHSRLISIGYTMPFISKQIVSWTDRDIYLQPRAKRPRTGERVHALRYQFSGFQRIDPLMVKNAWRSLAPRSLSQTRLFTVPLGGVNILAQCRAALWNRLKVIAGLKPRVNGDP